jgi:hypothetical protein
MANITNQYQLWGEQISNRGLVGGSLLTFKAHAQRYRETLPAPGFSDWLLNKSPLSKAIYDPIKESESTNRLYAKDIEKGSSTTGAEYEAFYGGYWRDISSDFKEDVSKAGNKFTRCIRWDDGFRSYRNDRGLIIRKKDKTQEGEPFDPDNDLVGSLQTFGGALAFSTTFHFAFEGVKGKLEPALARSSLNSLIPKSVGSFLSKNKGPLIYTGMNLLLNNDKSAGEKLQQAGIDLAVGTALTAVSRRLGPAGFLVFPALGIAKGIIEGDSFNTILAGTLGGLAGRQLGKTTGGKIFGTSTPSPTTPKPVSKEFMDTVSKQNIKSRLPDTLTQNRRAKTLTDALRAQLNPNEPGVNLQQIPQAIKNISKSYKENLKARIRNSSLGESKVEGLKTLANKLRGQGKVF